MANSETIKKEKRKSLEKLKEIYLTKQSEIKKRLGEFKKIWNKGSEEDVFVELIFCILTPQSRAISCWNSIKRFLDRNLLLKGDADNIAKNLSGVRFRYKKADYIIKARKLFTVKGRISVRSKIKQFNDKDAREWLVQNVKGIGYKEASHFLRNIGLGENLAILDRHILKNLKLVGEIDKIPDSLSRKRYIKIEKGMKTFAKKINMPIAHLDFVMWYKETGEIFK